MLSLWQKSSTNFMVRDKFKNPLNLTEHWKSKTNLKIHDKIHGPRQILKPYLDLKGFFNLSWTMKFVLDFCHRLSIGPVCDKIHGPRQI